MNIGDSEGINQKLKSCKSKLAKSLAKNSMIQKEIIRSTYFVFRWLFRSVSPKLVFKVDEHVVCIVRDFELVAPIYVQMVASGNRFRLPAFGPGA